jgi:retron-type reverse transcriptase
VREGPLLRSRVSAGKGRRVPMARTAEVDKVRELQRTLYRAAKADPGRRFHALHDKVHRRDVLERAWELVRRNGGAAGIDQQTIDDVERYGVDRLLDELAADLSDGSYRPLAARRVFIPKPGSRERRPLSIPAVRDRVVQAAARIVLEPIFEAGLPAVLVRVSPAQVGTRRAPSPRRRGVAGPAVGGRDGHRQLL